MFEDARVQEVRTRLKNRLRRLTFQALLQYNSKHREHTRTLKMLLKSSQLRQTKRALHLWLKLSTEHSLHLSRLA